MTGVCTELAKKKKKWKQIVKWSGFSHIELRAKRNGEILPCSLCNHCWTLQMEFPFRIVRVVQYGVLKRVMLLWSNKAFMTRATTKCFEICHKKYLSCQRQFSVKNETQSSHIIPACVSKHNRKIYSSCYSKLKNEMFLFESKIQKNWILL